GVDPERLDADDLLLLVGHRAGDVHHVDDRGHALRQVDFLPRAVLLVGPDGDDDRLGRAVGVRRDLPLQGALEGALVVAQRLRAGLADAGVAVAGGDDVLAAARLDARQGQLLAEDLGHLLHRQVDFQDVSARLVAGAGRVSFRRRERIAGLALSLADAAGALLAV